MKPKVYVGQTRSAKLIRRLWSEGIGECTVRGELPPRRYPWFFDNGAFGDWRAERPFDEAQFCEDIEAIRKCAAPPDFVVLPDIVAGGLESLAFSMSWVGRLQGFALYLAVQDGMTPADLPHIGGRSNIHGLFVGGTLGWKIRTGADWCAAARARGVACHVGRVGTETRIGWARRIGATSIDSALPLWSEENLERFLRGLAGRQSELALVSA